MKSAALGLAFLVALLPWLPATSQQPAAPVVPAYNIELIIFRATSALGGPENWAAEAGARNFSSDSNAGESSAGDTTQVGHFLQALPESQFQLTDVEKKTARERGLCAACARGLVANGERLGHARGIALQRLGIDIPGMTGTIVLERGQYLHLGMTLAYAPASPPAGLGAAPGTTFTLNEGRRVRFNERTYFDHPAFGVIALVTPVAGTRPARR